ncbi:MAG: RNA chaperone Hfq [Alphaproteobacteria bacterium]|nr:RNA chaperone Hfq [Alphaproteobacteria bacterium]MBE8219966.1 RNA chaperone Hfq [Alphaproteobacteria bacterium]
MPENDNSKLEENFLTTARKSAKDLTIFLVNGIKLQGTITDFNNETVVLTRAGQSQLVYRHAISTIAPDL